MGLQPYESKSKTEEVFLFSVAVIVTYSLNNTGILVKLL